VQLKLPGERIVRGRLIGPNGEPAAGVEVHVLRTGPMFSTLQFYEPEDGSLPFWPKPATTDDKGRFEIRGLGSDGVVLQVRSEQFGRQQFAATPVGADSKKEAVQALARACKVQGQVTCGETGKALPNAQLYVIPSLPGDRTPIEWPPTSPFSPLKLRADHKGRYSLAAPAGSLLAILACPPEGEPYLAERPAPVRLPQKARHTFDIALHRGRWVRGTVTEQGSGKPVAGARVQYRPRQANNPDYKDVVGGAELEENPQTAFSKADGTFGIAVLPGPGHLLVMGPAPDYVHVETSYNELDYGKAGGGRLYPDALVALDLKPAAEAHEVKVTLRRGVTRPVRVAGPDGKPVAEFIAFSPCYLPSGYTIRMFNRLRGRGGRFELPGCDPDRPVPVIVYDPENAAGASVELPPGRGDTPAAVRLKPCGCASLRFVDPKGKPVAGYRPTVAYELRPGIIESIYGIPDSSPWADYLVPSNFDRERHRDLATDKRGKLTVPALIPGLRCRIVLWEGYRQGKGAPTKDFIVEPGRELKLPDITIPEPE
jgi:hypothetical protein